MNNEHLFVYGTLRRAFGHTMHNAIARYACYLATAYYQGRLYEVADYPALIPSADSADQVRGELYQIQHPDLLFALLDEYEECSPRFPQPCEYQRIQQTVHLAHGKKQTAWLYCYQHDVSPLQRIISGDYLSHVRMRSS